MDADLAMTLGLFFGVLTIPSIVAAITEGRAPRLAALMLLISGGLVLFALSQNPGGYTLNDIPDVVLRVIGRFI